jgi:hypothetical protein
MVCMAVPGPAPPSLWPSAHPRDSRWALDGEVDFSYGASVSQVATGAGAAGPGGELEGVPPPPTAPCAYVGLERMHERL